MRAVQGKGIDGYVYMVSRRMNNYLRNKEQVKKIDRSWRNRLKNEKITAHFPPKLCENKTLNLV